MRDYRVLYDEARANLDQQLAAIDAIEAKIGVLFATASALVAIIAAIVAAAVSKAAAPSWEWFLLPTGLAYALVVFPALWVLWGGFWWTGTNVWKLADRYTSESDERVVLAAAKTLVEKYDANRPSIGRKVAAMRMALLGTLALTALSVLVGLVGVVLLAR